MIPANIIVPITFFLEIVQTTANVVVIVFSLRYVKPNLCRTYALNHAFPSLVQSSFALVLDFTEVTGWGREIFFKSPVSFTWGRKNWTSYIDATLIRFNANSYRVFATLMVLLTYISYSYPFFYSKLINNKNMMYIFAGGYVLVFCSLVLVLPKSTTSFFFQNSEYVTQIDILAYVFYCEKLFGLIFFIAMVVLYALSIYKIIQFSKKQQNSSSTGKRRSQLVSVLVYCTPPNIFLLLAMPRNFCIVTESTKVITAESFVQMCAAARALYSPSVSIRFLVSSMCTLIAFNDYRKIVVGAIKRLAGEQVSTSTVSVISQNSPQTQTTNQGRKTSTQSLLKYICANLINMTVKTSGATSLCGPSRLGALKSKILKARRPKRLSIAVKESPRPLRSCLKRPLEPAEEDVYAKATAILETYEATTQIYIQGQITQEQRDILHQKCQAAWDALDYSYQAPRSTPLTYTQAVAIAHGTLTEATQFT